MTVTKKSKLLHEEPAVSSVVAVGVVDDITLAQAHRAMPSVKGLFTSNCRGVLVNDVLGVATVALAMKLERRAFTLFYDRADRSFMCTVWRPDQTADECFAVGRAAANYRPIDSILGETTLDGILRVLDIPRRALFPDEDFAWPPWGN